MYQFIIALENDRLLNAVDLVNFCINHQQQDIELITLNEGHCLETAGVYRILDMFKFNSVNIITFNKLECHNLYNIDNTMWDYWLTNITSFDYNYDYEWNEQYIFGAIYGRPSAARLGIAGHLARYHNNKSLIKTKFDFSNEDTRIQFDLERLFSWDQSALSNIDLVNNDYFFSEHSYQRGSYTQSNDLSHLYKNFLIDIVVEPVYSGKSFYPTEKIVRAILCKRPFVVMAPRNYLDYLHQLGFYTFGEFWDEDYDGFESKDRYIKILQIIDSLAKIPKSKITDFYYSMQYYLNHNYKLLINKDYNRNVKLIS
jgi:hypothetical protein